MELAWQTCAITFFGLLLGLLLIGIPVGFCLIFTSMVALVIVGKGSFLYLFDVPGYFFHHLNSFSLICIPLFIYMAIYTQRAGFSDDLFGSLRYWLRWLPGSLAVVGVAACAVFAAISGTSVATAAAVGLVAVPEYKKYHYDPKLAVGSLAAGGSLGILIPPSIPMIMYCVVTGESIGRMFMGGILPGIMTAIIFIIYVVIRCIFNPSLAPKISRHEEVSIGFFRSLLNILPVATIILTVMLSLYSGIATETEVAAIGCMTALVLGISLKRISFKGIYEATYEGTKMIGFIIIILIGALAFGHAVVRGGIASGLSEWIVGLGFSRYAVLAMILSIMLILGCFMDPSPIILTTMPILYPLAMKYNFDPIFFGVVSVMLLETAAITPPVGFNLFVLRGIGKGYVSMNQIIIGAAPFVLLYLLCIVIVLFIPDIIMYLPNQMHMR